MISIRKFSSPFLCLMYCCCLLVGCSNLQSTPSSKKVDINSTSPSSPTSSQFTDIKSISVEGKLESTTSYLDVPIPVTIIVIAQDTDEVILYRRSSGTETPRHELARLHADMAQKTEDGNQKFVYEWTPTPGDFQDFIWAEATGKTGQTESQTIRLRYRR